MANLCWSREICRNEIKTLRKSYIRRTNNDLSILRKLLNKVVNIKERMIQNENHIERWLCKRVQ